MQATIVPNWALIKPNQATPGKPEARHDKRVPPCFHVHLGTKIARMDAMADPNARRVDEEIDLETKRLDLALGAELRGLRSKRGLSQDELAKTSGIGKRTLVRIEQGERAMTTTQLYKICRALGIKPSRLIDAVEVEIGID